LNPRSRIVHALIALAAWVSLAAVAGCGGVQVKPEDRVPPPLVDELPMRAGIHYSAEFRTFTHKEERWGTKWEVQLGGAHVTKLDRLLHAMFPKLVDVADLAKPPQPPLDLILEPRFEEYSFVTPRDAGAEFYAVTIKYRMNLYDGQARLIDSLVYTGYGNAPAGSLSTEKPLMIATERAMRDAGAKFATEFGDQATVKKLAAGETVEPAPGGTAAPAPGGIGEVTPTPGPTAPPPPATTGPLPPAAAPGSGAAPPGGAPPGGAPAPTPSGTTAPAAPETTPPGSAPEPAATGPATTTPSATPASAPTSAPAPTPGATPPTPGPTPAPAPPTDSPPPSA
jgi:hypothetical protein